MAKEYLDKTGLTYFWTKIKDYVNNAIKVTGVKGNSESSYRTGQVNLTVENIGAAAAAHSHGNITSAGALQTTDITIANGDKLVVTDASSSNKVARTSVAFDGSTTTQVLSKAGTFVTLNSYSTMTQSQATTGTDTTGKLITAKVLKDTISATTGAVTGVKGSSESSYRTGNVNITAANLGLSAMSASEATTGTATTSRLITAKVLADTYQTKMKTHTLSGTTSTAGNISSGVTIDTGVVVGFQSNASNSYAFIPFCRSDGTWYLHVMQANTNQTAVVSTAVSGTVYYLAF